MFNAAFSFNIYVCTRTNGFVIFHSFPFFFFNFSFFSRFFQSYFDLLPRLSVLVVKVVITDMKKGENRMFSCVFECVKSISSKIALSLWKFPINKTIFMLLMCHWDAMRIYSLSKLLFWTEPFLHNITLGF